MLSHEMDDRLEHVADGKNLTETIHALVNWAERHSRLLELIAAAHRANSNSAQISALYTASESWNFTPEIQPLHRRKPCHPDSVDSAFDYDVFISYSHADSELVVGTLLPKLQAQGIRACIDYRDFEIGAPSIREMEHTVVTSRRTLMVLTPAYLDSAWSEFEALMTAMLDPANRKRRLIPLLLKPCELPVSIAYLTYVSFASPPDEMLAWNQLLKALKPDPSASPSRPTFHCHRKPLHRRTRHPGPGPLHRSISRTAPAGAVAQRRFGLVDRRGQDRQKFAALAVEAPLARHGHRPHRLPAD